MCPSVLGDWQSYNDIHGATNNPWDRTRTPGRLLGRIGGGARRWFRSFVARLRHRRLFARSGAFLRGLRAQADPRAGRLPRSYARLACPRCPERPISPSSGRWRARSTTSSCRSILSPDRTRRRTGRGYRLSLPPARREKLAEFRVLFIAEHPLLPTSAGVGASLERLVEATCRRRRRRQTRDAAPAGSRGLRSALRQAPERRHVGAAAGQPVSGNAGRGREDSCRRSKLDRGARPRRRDEPSRMATGRFRSTGPQTAMARPVPRLRRRHLSAGRDASLSARSFVASGSAEARCRRQGSSLSGPTGLGRTRDDLRPAGDRRSHRASRTVCRSACRSSARNTRTGRRSPSPARSSASSAVSRPRPVTHSGVRAARHTRRRRDGLSASDRRGGDNRERGEGVLETLTMRSHSGPPSGQLPTQPAHSDCG